MNCHCMLRDRKDVVGTVIDFCPLHTAAPDLLEALRELLYVTEPLESGALTTPFKNARAAIAKAEGRLEP